LYAISLAEVKRGSWMFQGQNKASADVISCIAPWRARIMEAENRFKRDKTPINSALDSVVY